MAQVSSRGVPIWSRVSIFVLTCFSFIIVHLLPLLVLEFCADRFIRYLGTTFEFLLYDYSLLCHDISGFSVELWGIKIVCI